MPTSKRQKAGAVPFGKLRFITPEKREHDPAIHGNVPQAEDTQQFFPVAPVGSPNFTPTPTDSIYSNISDSPTITSHSSINKCINKCINRRSTNHRRKSKRTIKRPRRRPKRRSSNLHP